MSKIYTVKLSEEMLRLVELACKDKLHDLQCEAEGSDFQHCRDRAERELEPMAGAILELNHARCYLEESKV